MVKVNLNSSGEKRFVWYIPLNREFPFWEALFVKKISVLRKNL